VNIGWQHQWVIDYESSKEVIKHAYEAGINFIDTANIYSLGTSEEFVGRALKELGIRDKVVLATKVYMPMRDEPNSRGLSRKAIMYEVEQSLKRLQTDYIDLYIIHRWDYETPIEETMKALHDLVESGKVRYIGASAMYTWQFQKAQYIAEKNGWTKFISMQNHHNLMYREEEREMDRFCEDSGVGTTPYSPLASGRLVKTKDEHSQRFDTDKTQESKYGKMMDADQIIIDRVAEIAEKKGVKKAQIALAWLLTKKPVVAPIVGATKLSHIDDALGALDIVLTKDEIDYLEEAYIPHPIMGQIEYR
jgi:aryl-alcohol dehydrogenase-like predicted oxidoreductase